MTDQMYKRIQEINQSPLNQVCMKKLFQAKQRVDDSQVHLLQLANWGLEEFKERVPDAHLQYAVENELTQLSGGGTDPTTVMLAFFPDLNEPDHEQEQAENLSGLSPAEAAESLLEDLMCEVD